MNIIISYKSCIETIAKNYEVHRMIQFLTNLAKQFHSFYSNNKIIDPASPELSKQRYWLCQCVKIIIANGLRLLDITPVDEM
jgi:arginyl-tRNA synthetase